MTVHGCCPRRRYLQCIGRCDLTAWVSTDWENQTAISSNPQPCRPCHFHHVYPFLFVLPWDMDVGRVSTLPPGIRWRAANIVYWVPTYAWICVYIWVPRGYVLDALRCTKMEKTPLRCAGWLQEKQKTFVVWVKTLASSQSNGWSCVWVYLLQQNYHSVSDLLESTPVLEGINGLL